MHTFPNEVVDVTVDFSGNLVRPCAVRFAGHFYPITKVGLVKASTEGARKIFYFSVSDPANFFKLRFDAETLEWRLMETYAQ
jgi:hypothetical protein